MNVSTTSLNLADEISKQAEARPDATAIQHPDGIMTFRELDDLGWKTATFLSLNHVKKGDVVALTFASNLTEVIMMLALARIGATVFSIPANLPTVLRAEMATDVKAVVMATDLPEGDDAGLPRLLIDMNSISKNSSPIDYSVRDPKPKAPWIIVTGSGSTGDPKKIPFGHTQFLVRMSFSNRADEISVHDRIGSLPPLDTFMTKVIFFFALCSGASIALPGPQMTKSFDWIRAYNVSVLWAVVVNAEQLLNALSQGMPNPLGLLRVLRIGASTVSDSLRKRITKSLTPNLYISYATNEVGLVTLATPADIAATPDTVGRPFEGVKVEIVDAEGKILPVGETGFVRVHSPGVISSYLDNKEASDNAFRDGWFYPGDLGKFTQEGQLIYCGRADHMMIMNGINIYPAEIEAVITKHPAVRDAAAVPLHHHVYQDIPVCAVALHQGMEASIQELQDFAFQRLGNRGAKMIFILEEIPRNDMGKLIREQLMLQITARLSQRIETGGTVKDRETSMNVSAAPINVIDEISKQAEARPDAIAIQHPDGIVTYRQLENLIWKAATFLSMNSVKPGDVVAITFTSDLTALVTMLALGRIGATVFSIPANSPALLRKEMAADVKAVVLATDLPKVNNAGLPRLLIDINTFSKTSSPIDPSVRDPNPSAPWHIITGSGSTGDPKNMPFSHTELHDRMLIINRAYEMSANDRVGSLLSLDTLTTKFYFFYDLCAGASIALPGPQMTRSFDWIRDYKVSVLYGVVVNAEDLLNAVSKGMPNPLGSLRVFSLSSSTISDSLRKRITKSLTPNLYIVWGTNELGLATIATPADIAKNPDTVGRTLEGMTIEIVDDKGNILPAGEIGFIRARGSGMTNSYLDNNEASDNAFKDGWFYPGDLGKFTPDGQLIFCGRADHMMIMNGINIYPAEIEAVITRHPAVRDAAAVPLRHPVHQEIPVCTVTLHQGAEASTQELQDFVFQRLGNRSAKMIFILEEIPRNDMGKLIREKLMQKINSRLNVATNRDFDRSKSADGQNEIPPLVYSQQMRMINLQLEYPADIDLQGVDAWLQSVLGIELSPCNFPKPKHPREAAVAEMAWRCLLLMRTFLQVGNIPAFDAGRVLKLTPNKEDPSKWDVLVIVAFIEHIPPACYGLVTDAAVKTIRWVLGRAITSQHVGQLYNYLGKQVLDPLKKMAIPGKSRIPVLRVAHQLDIPFSHLGAGIYQLGWGSRARRMDRSTTEMDSALGSRLAQNKVWSANLLHMAGLPAPVQRVAATREDAFRAARQIGWPLVVKPADLDRGEGVAIGIKDDKSLVMAFSAASKLSKDKLVVIEREVPGVCHRLFVAGGQLLYSVKRLPKSVIGNGNQTVAELIRYANIAEQRLPPWQRSQPFPSDALAVEALATVGFSLDSVPAEGKIAPLRKIESTEWGGFDEDVTAHLHPANLDIALRAADLLSLNVAGIDIISTDITKPWYENGAIINEVNFSPLLGGGDISREHIPSFLRRYIEGDGRIPIDVVVGGKAALDNARELQQKLVSSGKKCFLTSHELTLTASFDEMPLPFTGLNRRCRALLMNHQVEVVVLVVQTDELMHTGMPVDRINNMTTVDKDLTDWQKKDEKLPENRIDRLTAMLTETKNNKR